MNQKREGIKYTLSHTDKRKAGGAKHFTARNKKERKKERKERKKRKKEKKNKTSKQKQEMKGNR